MKSRSHRHRPPNIGDKTNSILSSTHTHSLFTHNNDHISNDPYYILDQPIRDTLDSRDDERISPSSYSVAFVKSTSFHRYKPFREHKHDQNKQFHLSTLSKKTYHMTKPPKHYHNHTISHPKKFNKIPYRPMNTSSQSMPIPTNSKKYNREFPSLFTSTHSRQRNKFTAHNRLTMSSTAPVTTKSEPITDTNHASHVDNVPNPSSDENSMIITVETDLATIKTIPVAVTWQVYLSNTSNPMYTEHEWTPLTDDDKYNELLKLRPSMSEEVTNLESTFVLRATTTNATINKFPKNECKAIFKTYATTQGYPHFVEQIDRMLVTPLRQELIKARDQLAKRMHSNTKGNETKMKHIMNPFVLTHDTTDNEIDQASETALLSELKSMYEERGQYDTVMWESLFLEDIRNMIKSERDEMRQCFTHSEPKESSDEPETIIIMDEDEFSNDSDDANDTDDSDDDDIDMDTDEVKNDADDFVKRELDKEIKNTKKLRFELGYDTNDNDIFSLNRLFFGFNNR